MKGIGLGILGLGALGCAMYPMGYIPSQLYFITTKGPTVTWAILGGLIVVGGAIWYFGMKSEQKKDETPS